MRRLIAVNRSGAQIVAIQRPPVGTHGDRQTPVDGRVREGRELVALVVGRPRLTQGPVPS